MLVSAHWESLHGAINTQSSDTAYILAYSTILLNTDAHTRQLKKQNRMTKAEFMKNNRGINDGADVPEDVLMAIYDEIQTNEIRMKDEIDIAVPLPAAGPGLANALANVGRDLQMEAYVMQTNNMANKTEVISHKLSRNHSVDSLYFHRLCSRPSCAPNAKDHSQMASSSAPRTSSMSSLCSKSPGSPF